MCIDSGTYLQNHFYKFNGKNKWNEQLGNTESNQELRKYMLNAYRVLLTRGAKGCYIYCQDEEYQEFIKNVIKNINIIK